MEGGSISVSARREGDFVLLEVADTGMGLPAAQANRPGFGLTQVRERLASSYGAAAAIDLVAGHAVGSKATARFPFNP